VTNVTLQCPETGIQFAEYEFQKGKKRPGTFFMVKWGSNPGASKLQFFVGPELAVATASCIEGEAGCI
jgi:hypothetical protein